MEAVLLVIHLIIAVSIIIVVMLQPAESGGGLLGGSAGNAMMPRRSADFMTRLTTLLAIGFFSTSLLLAIVASHQPEQKGILDLAAEGAPAVEEQAPVPEPEPETPKAPTGN